MSKNLLILLFILVGSFLSNSQTVIDFETAGAGYTPSGTEGAGFTDVFNRTNPNIGGNSSYIWSVEDLSLSNPSIVLDQIDITGATSFTFSLDMIAHHYNDWDNADELLITYSIDGGAYQNLMWVQNNGGAFNETASLDTDFDGDGECGVGITLPSLTTGTSGCNSSSNVFETFTSSSISLSGNATLDITLQFNGLTSTDEGIYLDDITITTVGGSPSPNLSVSTNTLTGYTYVEGSGPSTSQSFDLTGSNMDGSDVTITAPTNYEISTDDVSFSNSITLTAYGGGSTTIYVRLKAGLTAGTYNGENITIVGGGDATGETVSNDGTVTSAGGGCATDLIISEYIEGSSNNKYIEIFNKTGSTVDLSDYRLRTYTNGNTSPTYDNLLSGTLADGATKVYRHSSATIYGGAATVATACGFNGDDAVALYKISSGSNVDIIGCIGEDPGSAWTSGSHSTANKTLVRKAAVTGGVTTNPGSGFPTLTTEWDVYAQNDITYLGSHTMTCGPCVAPTTEATLMVFSTVTESSMTVSWTNGDGTKRIVVARAGSAVTSDPVDGSTYTANAVFGSGDDIGTNEYVVYEGTGSTVDVTGLSHSTTYYFKVFEYNCDPGSEAYLTTSPLEDNQATVSCSQPTVQATTITFSSVGSSSMNVSWTDGNGAGRIVKCNTVNSFTNPVDGTDPTANPVYGGGEQVVYNGTGSNVTVTGLSPSTTYWFRVYEYNCSGTNIDFYTPTASGNPNSQATTAAPVPAVLSQGDFAIVGVCSNINQSGHSCVPSASAGDDEISFVCFKDITTGTVIDLTDNGWQRENANEHGNTEGYYRVTRTGSTIAAGTVITIRLHNNSPFFEGFYPDNDWSLDIKTSGACVLNSNGDQIFFMQGGTWNDGTFGDHDATYTGGEYLFGFNTYSSWDDFGFSTQRSGIMDGMDCFNMMPSGATDFLKYTGPQTPATQIEWIGRINDNTNWTSFGNCTDYYSTTPNYETGHTITISATGVDLVFNWYGNKNTEWFDCANWGTLRIPDASTSVEIPNDVNVDNNIVLIAGETAECKDFTISHPSYAIVAEGDATKVLTCNRDFIINDGTVDFDDGNDATADGTINVNGNWQNNASTTDFLRGNSTVNFVGSAQSIISNDKTENFHNVNIVSPTVVNCMNNDLLVSGDWDNYAEGGFTEGIGEVEFDGSSLQDITTPGGETFYDMEVNNTSDVRQTVNVTVSNILNLEDGDLRINGNSLTIQNTLTRNTGFFAGTSASDLIINGTGNLTTALYFSTGNELLDICNINRASDGTVTMGTDLTVGGQLALVSGNFAIDGNHLTLNGTVSGTGELMGSAASEMTIGGSGALGTLNFSVGTEELQNLTTNRSSGNSILGNDLTVNNQLTLTNGLITTSSYWLIVSNNAASSVAGHNTNSYISGNLRRYIANNTDTYALPVGVATRYTLAEIVNGNLSGITYLDAVFLETFTNSGSLNGAIARDNGTPYTSIASEGIWQIDPNAAPSGGDYDILLWFNDGGGANPFTGLSDGQFGPLKRSSASTSAADWAGESTGTLNAIGTAGTTVGGGYAQRSGITSFSKHCIGISTFVLPVELLFFNAQLNNDVVELKWETATEINNDYFTIERSEDGIHFYEIERVAGAGTSSIKNTYFSEDTSPLNGINYYRLKQTDFDGTFSYSNVISVRINSEEITNLYFDQENYTLNATFNISNSSRTVVVSDMLGRKLFNTVVAPEATHLIINLEKGRFSDGIYVVSVFDQNNIETKKILIQ